MNDAETDPTDLDVLTRDIPDEELEAAGAAGTVSPPTLLHNSYCFGCQ
jgi:hypothetical protein